MQILMSIISGYLLGSLSPAALLSRLKKKNLRSHGTGNLGATNTMLVFGRKYGVLVMVFDIAKAFCAVKLARNFFPFLDCAGLLAGCASVLGHIFPFYLKFRGGKGLACFAGLILGVDPFLFPILLAAGLLAMFVTDHGYAMSITAAILFPILHSFHCQSFMELLICLGVSFLVGYQNYMTYRMKKRNQEEQIRISSYIRRYRSR